MSGNPEVTFDHRVTSCRATDPKALPSVRRNVFDIVKNGTIPSNHSPLIHGFFSVSYEKLQCEQLPWLASPVSAMDARVEVLIAVPLKMPVFWHVTLCRGASGFRRFEAS